MTSIANAHPNDPRPGASSVGGDEAALAPGEGAGHHDETSVGGDAPGAHRSVGLAPQGAVSGGTSAGGDPERDGVSGQITGDTSVGGSGS